MAGVRRLPLYVRRMNNKVRIAFLALIALQALHSLEEFIFRFHEAFPPMVLLYRDAPHLARPAFIIFNLLLVLAGVACLWRWVWPVRRGARAVVWVWVGIEAANALAHLVWAALIRGYNPGLVTGVGLAAVVVYLSSELRRASAHGGA